jgi:glycosyltransferase involved in cell wall biosynthesis
MPAVVCHLSTVHPRSDVRVFYKECVSLSRSGYKVHLVVADGKGDNLDLGVMIHDVGFPSNRFTRILLSPVKVLLAAIKTKARMFHFHDPELLPLGLLLKLITKAKVIYDAHECYPDDLKYKEYLSLPLRIFASWAVGRLEGFVARHIDAVVTVSDHHAKRFLGYNPQTAVVHNFPLLSEWQALMDSPVSKQPHSLCYVGNITRKRGISQLLEAIDNLDVILHLAGTYEPADYREELQKLPAWGKVKEYGYVNRDQAVKIISQAQIGVMLFLPEPNHINSLSTKVFEYMAGATCVIVSDFPVYQALISSQLCGISVNPLDTKSIADAIQALIADPNRCLDMGIRGRELISTKYNWEKQAIVLLSLYKTLKV